MPRHNTPEDFWKRVKIGRLDECWPWQGPVTDRGYGKLSFGGKNKRAHQVAFYLRNGYYPRATLHQCDNPPCCNADHLFPGDNGINNSDRAQKGRSHRPANELHPACRLSNQQVIEIRRLAATHTYASLGRMYGVHGTTVSQIVRGLRRSL